MFKYQNGFIFKDFTFVVNKEDVRNAKDEDFVEGTALLPIKYGRNISLMHPVDEFICSECGLTMRENARYEYDEDGDDWNCYEFEFSYCPRCGVEIEED